MSDQLRSWLMSHHQKDGVVSTKAKVLALTSGKGGVGKTSLSLKIAKLFSSMNKKVLIIDCDYNLSNTFVKLGVSQVSNFQKYIKSLKDFEDCVYKDGNMHVLAGCNGDLDLFDTEFKLDHFYISLLTRLESKYDLIILDTPAGMAKDLMSLIAYADHRAFVVNPDRASITDSYACMKVLAKKYGIKDNFLLVNSFNTEKQYKNIIKALSETVENFLQARLVTIGGVRKSQLLGQDFDKELLGENSALHKDSHKVVSKLAELMDMPVGELASVVPDSFSRKAQDKHEVYFQAN